MWQLSFCDELFWTRNGPCGWRTPRVNRWANNYVQCAFAWTTILFWSKTRREGIYILSNFTVPNGKVRVQPIWTPFQWHSGLQNLLRHFGCARESAKPTVSCIASGTAFSERFSKRSSSDKKNLGQEEFSSQLGQKKRGGLLFIRKRCLLLKALLSKQIRRCFSQGIADKSPAPSPYLLHDVINRSL